MLQVKDRTPRSGCRYFCSILFNDPFSANYEAGSRWVIRLHNVGDNLKISIRNALENDINEIMLIEQGSFHANIVESRDVFLDRIRIFPQGFLVLEIGNLVVGYICSELWEHSEDIPAGNFRLNHTITEVHRNDGTQLYISSLGILQEHRKKGYGKKLFSELEKRAIAECRISSMVLVVSVRWGAAIRIYEKHGFREIQRIKYFFDDSARSDAIVMRKQL
ncbi:GNAT family N-acetyltransferase [Methanolobus sp. WCC5]|jgi:ribosomal-protein-alanine N-acetyltransferase|uniref:GNAT family N-acetyltransferase n=1 Tax=Methanolobus sp. WCC5 TaxID=3125785 RepID=UPI00324892E5